MAATPPDVERRLEALFDELDRLLKDPDAGAALGDRGVNTSLALLAAAGLRAYLAGQKREGAEDLAAAAEEIAARLGRPG